MKQYRAVREGDLYGTYRRVGDLVTLTDEQAAELLPPRGAQIELPAPALPSAKLNLRPTAAKASVAADD